MTPFPIIVGCGRSGTTLLRAMADAHPDLAVPPESHFVVPLADRFESAFDVDAFAEALTAHERFALWALGREDVARALREARIDDVAAAFRVVYRMWAAGNDKPRYADKTPAYVLHIEQLAVLFPEAVFVHLVRDGRDVASSFLDLGWSPTIEHAALHWQLRVQRGRAAGRLLAPGRYVELRYEELVADPEPTLRRMADAIDLPFAPAMLDPSERAGGVIETTGHPDYHRHLSKPPTAGLRNWRTARSDAEVARFEILAGDTLTDFGYVRHVPDPPRSTRITARVRMARWQLHRVRQRVVAELRSAGRRGRPWS